MRGFSGCYRKTIKTAHGNRPTSSRLHLFLKVFFQRQRDCLLPLRFIAVRMIIEKSGIHPSVGIAGS